jgi:ATP-binding cassette, subfamily C (CFTR/MRP), member 1
LNITVHLSILSFGPDILFLLLAALRLGYLLPQKTVLRSKNSGRYQLVTKATTALLVFAATSAWLHYTIGARDELALWIVSPVMQLISSVGFSLS